MNRTIIIYVIFFVVAGSISFLITREYWFSVWKKDYLSEPITLKFGKAHQALIHVKSDTIPLTQRDIDEYIDSRYRIRNFDMDFASLIVGVVGLVMVMISLLLFREFQSVREYKKEIDILITSTEARVTSAMDRFDNDIDKEKDRLVKDIENEKERLVDAIEKSKKTFEMEINDTKVSLEEIEKKAFEHFNSIDHDQKQLHLNVIKHNAIFDFIEKREQYNDTGIIRLLDIILAANIISRDVHTEINNLYDVSNLFSPNEMKRKVSATNLRGRATERSVIEIMKNIILENNLTNDYKSVLLSAIEDLSARLGANNSYNLNS